MAELREQKETYEPGFWNVNSVLLGGLGRDPHIVGMHGYIQSSSLCCGFPLVHKDCILEEEAEEQMSLGGSEATAPMKMAHTGTTVLYRSKVASHDATPRYCLLHTAFREPLGKRRTCICIYRQTGLDTAPSGAASHNKSHNTVST